MNLRDYELRDFMHQSHHTRALLENELVTAAISVHHFRQIVA